MSYPQQPGQPAFFQQAQPPVAQPQFTYPTPQPGAPAYFSQPPAPQPQAPQAQNTQAATSFSDFWDQRASGEGKAISFKDKPFGTTHIFQITRPLTKGDIQHQTNAQGTPQYNRDGSPKWVLVIPGRTPAGEDVTWWCKGQAKTALQAALTLAGATEPEFGGIVQVTYVRDKQNSAGYQPTKIVEVTYTRPQNAATSAPAPAVETTQAPPAVVPEQTQAQAVVPVAQAPTQTATPVAPAAAPQAPVSDPQALFQSLIQN